jgi:hypothetical protein
MARKPLTPISSVFQDVFEHILSQKVSLPGDRLDDVIEAVAAARRRHLPLLFVVHKDHENEFTISQWNEFAAGANKKTNVADQLAERYVVISMPLSFLPACSQRLEMRPYAAPYQASPLFVVARPDGRQVAAVTSWNKPDELKKALATGLVQEAKEELRSKQQLQQLLTLITPVDRDLTVELRQMIAARRYRNPVSREADAGAKVAMRNDTTQTLASFNVDQ